MVSMARTGTLLKPARGRLPPGTPPRPVGPARREPRPVAQQQAARGRRRARPGLDHPPDGRRRRPNSAVPVRLDFRRARRDRPLARSSAWPSPRPSRRLPLEKRRPILEALLAHAEDADDHNLPLMEWYAFEPLAAADPAAALKLAQGRQDPQDPAIHGPAGRRAGHARGPGERWSRRIGQADRSEPSAGRCWRGSTRRSRDAGQRRPCRPPGPGPSPRSLKDADAEVRSQATALALTFGDASALPVFRAVVADPKADLGLRREALAALLKARDAGLVPTLQTLVDEPAMRGAWPSAPSPPSTTRRRPRSS